MKVKGWTTIILLLLTVAGCGVIGPPVPPDSIGVNVKRHNDTVERERRIQEAGARQGRGQQGPGPQGPAEQPPSLSDDVLLRGEEVQPSARPDSDFLVRPR